MLILSAFILPSSTLAAAKPYAEWCQCAIFVVNHLGLEIIPGDYYTAGSFVVPDKTGRTWMDYQGFSRRAVDQAPQNGDVIVIRPNGRVYFPEGGESTRLQAVNVDAWAGHIGVIETAEAVDWEGRSYWRLGFLSSNWGVNASPMMVRSNCFNVDRSQVMVERDDADVSFWRQTDAPLQRQHILNIVRQLAFGYYHIGVDGTADGYPNSGAGLIAYAWNMGWQPGQSFESQLAGKAQEIPLRSLKEGDALVMDAGEGTSFYGLFSGLENMSAEEDSHAWYESGQVYWFDPSSGRLQGPKALREAVPPMQAAGLRAYRSMFIRAVMAVDNFEVAPGSDGAVEISYRVRNEGGETLRIDTAGLMMSTLQGARIQPLGEFETKGVEIPSEQEFVYSAHIRIQQGGVYFLQPLVTANGNTIAFPEQGAVNYIAAGSD